MFREAVVIYGMTYDRFREDFINSHMFHDEADAACKNDHQVNLGRIGSLLLIREDLVRKYSVVALDRGAFLQCMKEFMLKSSTGCSRSLSFGCYLDGKTIGVLTYAINDIPLFKRSLSEEEVESFFNGCTPPSGAPLMAVNNGVFAYFFSLLCYHSIISSTYQAVLAHNRLVVGSSGKRFMTQADISVALSHFLSSDPPIIKKIKRWVLLIKKSTFSDMDSQESSQD